MNEIIRIAIDLSKGAFALHGVNADEDAVLRRELRRGQVLGFFAKLPSCMVGMEACASAHYWARAIAALGHRVVLIPPAYVKPYVKRGRKNDANDAAAICEAMARRSVTTVPVKTPEQQAALMLHRARKLLVGQRTMLANAMRAHLAEFGIVAPCGEKGLDNLIALAVDAADPALPPMAREALGMLAAQLRDAEVKIDALEREMLAAQRRDEASQRLTTIPSIGPITASAIAATMGDPRRFKTGRDFAAWLGLVPSQHSTGGKTSLGPITKTGDRYLRSLLVVCATGMLRHQTKSPWIKALLERMPARKATVAIANKLARIAWAILAHGGTYRSQAGLAA
ncbi:IS110 family transposase [Paramagnetospirillum kuznetsovii]|uniref:IS110 family transposase n=1 Tax=Paramagnetospirillum kuznetsovii TaxID=2053833 RepID=A0A364NSA7_9PROT|nr:IS110 family transposase [Paramagnetospirillum kuznetsovii]RAU19971.1 IS110 family transposase [Paramagnetospirillum kuznetsovii]